MPNTSSAKKAMRQSEKRTNRNTRIQEQIIYAVKSVRKAVAAGNATEAATRLLASQKTLDKATQKRVIKKNTAARRKSRLARLVHAMSSKE